MCVQVARNASCINTNLDALGKFSSFREFEVALTSDASAFTWMLACATAPYPPWNTSLNLPAWTPGNRGY